jgi:hypothetical protein
MEAAGSSRFPRATERRHFRTNNARKSVAFLKERGVDGLFNAILASSTWPAAELIRHVSTWEGFGPWISFKVADMLERLGILRAEFDLDTAV